MHAKGGKLVMQLWHVGRISHTSLQPDGQEPVSSTSRRANAKTFTAGGFEDVSMPWALRLDEIPGIVSAYRLAARLAMGRGVAMALRSMARMATCSNNFCATV